MAWYSMTILLAGNGGMAARFVTAFQSNDNITMFQAGSRMAIYHDCVLIK